MVQADELEQACAARWLSVAGLATMFSTFDVTEVAVAPSSTSSRWPCTSALASASSCTGCATDMGAAARRPPASARPRGATRRPVRPAPQPHGPALRTLDRNVDAWIDGNPATERLQTLAEIRVGHVFDTTTLPVAVREVRNLLLVGSVGAAYRSAARARLGRLDLAGPSAARW